MKISVLFVLLAILGANSFAEGIIPIKSLPTSNHVVVSDKRSSKIPDNKCRVVGHVYNMDNENKALAGCLVASLDRTHEFTTDSTGYFELFLNAGDTCMFAFKSMFTEHVIWNYPFKSGHLVEINFFLTNNDQLLEVDKPVIYLYSEQEQEVNVSLDFPGELSFTYPVYENGWCVRVSPAGIQQHNRQYLYLFWEGKTKDLTFSNNKAGEYEGYVINTDSAISFLENSLDALGFNYTESTDFITFWAPKLAAKRYAFIQFFIDEDYSREIAQIQIHPKPDHMRRVFMLFSGYDYRPDFCSYCIKEPTLTGFERKGLTVLEWGGSEYQSNYRYEKILADQ